ncbi:MAG: histidinol-phosphate transaminase [Hyphomicrobiales bacterium]
MSLKFPEHILSIPSYVPGKPVEEVERERGIRHSIKLASNENPLGPSPKALAALRRTLPSMHRYPDSSGYELTRRLALRFHLDPAQIVLGNGSDDIIGMLARSILQPGDEVIMPKPSFQMYEIETRSAAAVPVEVPLKGFRTDLEAMAAKITPRTRIVFVNTPHNPTGSLVTRSEIEAFMALLPADVILVIDEAYIEFVRDPAGANSLDWVRAGRPVVGLRTFSKAYGLAGLRIGYGLMPAEVAGVLQRVRPPFNVNLAAQAAAAAALDDSEFLKETLKVVHEGVDYLHGALTGLGLACLPTQSNFLMFQVPGDAGRVFEGLLDRGVIVRPLTSYGYPDRIRVNAGQPEENRRFIKALREALAL